MINSLQNSFNKEQFVKTENIEEGFLENKKISEEKQLRGPFSFYGESSSVRFLRFFSEGTLFHVLEPGRLKREKGEIRKWSFSQKMLKGLWLGIKWNGPQLLMVCIPLFTKGKRLQSISLNENEKFFLILAAIFAPFFEELAFRFFLQNVISILQVGIKHSKFGREHPGKISWLCSPSCRILAEWSLFVSMHLFSKYNHIRFAHINPIRNAVEIAFYPAYSILYYLTGSIFPSMFAHSVNNVIGYTTVYLDAMKSSR